MNIEETKEAIKVMQAFVDKKEVEVMGLLKTSFWLSAETPCWDWNTSTYRIKPTAKLRPWTPDEVPLGAWMRNMTNSEYRWLINTSSLDDTRKAWLQQGEHSTDGGKTWLPCGVVEESK
jgi:hypothetical protein